MKQLFRPTLSALLFACCSLGATAQVAIGTGANAPSPNADAVLLLEGNGSQGVIIPAVNSLGNFGQPGMIVYNKSTATVHYAKDRTTWVQLGGSGSQGLQISGNTITIGSGPGFNTSFNIASTAPAVNGQILMWDALSGSWTTSMNTAPSAVGQVLKWNGSKWEPGTDQGGSVPTLSNGQILIGNGTANSPALLSGDATLAAGALTISNNAVTTAKIADANVTNIKLANNSVDASKITDGSVSTADLAGNISITTSGNINAANFTGNGSGLTGITATVADGSITGGTAGAGVKLAANTITDANVLSLDAGKITSGTLPIARIAAGAVDNTKLATGIDAAKINTGTLPIAQVPNLDAAKITSGTLTIPFGGTGATTAPAARTALGLGTLSTLNSVTSAEITNATIVDADINASAAIAGSKINPDFGAQPIVTTGSLNAGPTTLGVTTTGELGIVGGVRVAANNPISGTVAGTQGLYLQWNRTVGEGESWILNQKGTGSPGGIRFGDVTNTNVVTEWMRIQNGNVGIGNPSPTAKLDIIGNIKIVDGTQGAGKILTSDGNGLASWQPATGGGNMFTTNNLSDLTNFATARANLGLGSVAYTWPAANGTGVLTNNGAGALSWSPAGSGSVTTVSVTTANGFSGTVINPSLTPAISIGTPLTGMLKGNGTGLAVATAGTDYQAPLTLTTTGTSGAATLVGSTLNVPNYTSTTYSAGTGLSLASNTFSVNPSQNITTLSNLNTNGLIKTTGGTGALSIATAGTDYLTPTGIGSGLTSLNASNISSGTLAIANGGTNSTATPTSGGVSYGTGTAFAFTPAGISGQILQSNGAAAPTWVNSPATTTASNGLTKTGSDIALGGTLTNGTTIANGGFNLAITGSGNVGIGTTPAYKLDVAGTTQIVNNAPGLRAMEVTSTTGDAINVSATGTGNTKGIQSLATVTGNYATGLFGTAVSNDFSFGVVGAANGTGNFNYGVQANAGGAATTNYGLYAAAINGTTNWAGYFAAGNVHITNGLSLGATPGTFGTAGQVLTSAGPGLPPTWSPAGGGGNMFTTNNLSDLTNFATARANLGFGSVAYTWPAANGTGVLTNNGAGALSWSPAGSGSVTTVSVTTANGFSGTVLNPSLTPAISIGTPLTGMLKGNGTGLVVANAGTDYQAPITLTTTGTSGAATLIGNTLNVPNYAGTTYSAGTGLTLASNIFSVNASQNITTLSNLNTNGLIKTTGGTGALSIATAGTDYLTPTGIGSGLTSLNASNISSGTLAITNGGTNSTATPTNGGVSYGTGSAYAFTAAGTSGQILQSNGAAAPTWVNAPASFNTNNLIPKGNGSTLVASGIQDDGTTITLANKAVINTTPGFGNGLIVNSDNPISSNMAILANSSNGTAGNTGVSSQAVGGFQSIGVQATASSALTTIGLDAIANGTGTVFYGVRSNASGNGVNYAVFGTSLGGTTNWAGYFAAGNVHITNGLSVGATPGTFGTAGQVLTSAGAGAPPTWTTISGGGNMITTNNLSDLTNFASARANLGLGSVAYTWPASNGTGVLTNDGAGTLTWGPAGLTNPLTTTGDIIYGVGTTPTRLAGAAGFLRSTGAAAPAWSAVNLASADVTGTLPIARGGTNVTTTPNNGQVLIGNGAGYSLATLTQGSGVTITNGAGTITIASTGMTNPLTTNGDIIYGVGSTPTRLAAGTGFLRGGTVPSYSAVGLASADVTGTLPVANGGTGLSTFGGAGLLYASAATTMGNISNGTAGQMLLVTGSTPTWQSMSGDATINGTGALTIAAGAISGGTGGKIADGTVTGADLATGAVDLTSGDVTGILPVALGGTNSSATATNGGVGYGTGTAHAYTTAGTSGQLLQSNGAAAPTWVNPVREVADEFTAVASQTSFTLTQTPSANSRVKFYINGIRISNTAYSVVGTTLTYNATNNGTYVLSAGDRVQCDYFY